MKEKLWLVFAESSYAAPRYYLFAGAEKPTKQDIWVRLKADGETSVEAYQQSHSGVVSQAIDPMSIPFTSAADRVRLWWKAESMSEVQAWTSRVISAGGDIDKIEKQIEPSGRIAYAFIFNLSRTVALEQLAYSDASFQENDLVAPENELDEEPDEPEEYSIKAVCPNDPTHWQFTTVAHEMHDWRVDRYGECLDDLGCLEVTTDPDPENTWTCCTCGAKAQVS